MTNTSIFKPVAILLLSSAAIPALSGCQQNTPEIVAEKNEPLVTKPTLCADLDDAALNDRGQANCVLNSNDGSGLILEVRYGAPRDGDEYGAVEVEIKAVLPYDDVKQTIKETSEFVYGLPKLQDLDGDGRNELLVPLMTGNVNTVYALWRGVTSPQPYTRVGEISGVSFEAMDDGMFSASARASAASWVTSYYKFIDGDISNIATAMVELPADQEGEEKCTLSDDGGLALTGLTLAQAQDKFCG